MSETVIRAIFGVVGFAGGAIFGAVSLVIIIYNQKRTMYIRQQRGTVRPIGLTERE